MFYFYFLKGEDSYLPPAKIVTDKDNTKGKREEKLKNKNLL